MGDNFTNPGGSIRRNVNMPPNLHPYQLIQYPPRHQQPPQSTYHHRPYPPQPNNYSNPIPLPVPTTSYPMRMPHDDYRNNIFEPQCSQQQVSMDDGWNGPRGSSEHLRVPLPPSVQTRSLLQPPPQLTPPPPVLTPHPPTILESVQHPPPQLGVLVPVPATIQHIQKEKQEKGEEVETDETSLRELAAKASGLHKEYGQLVARLLLSHEKKSNELKISNKVVIELRAEKEVINGQLIESKDQNVRLNGKIEDVEKKAELIVQRAKSEENIWRNKFMELNEKHTALKKELDEKDSNIRVLKEKDTDNESKIAQQNVQVLNFEMSERRLKKDLEVKEKEVECFSKKVTRLEINIMEEEGKVRNLESSEEKLKEELEKYRDQLSKLKVDFSELTTTTKELDDIITKFVEKETNFKLHVQELQTEILEKSAENSKISGVLEKERNDNQVEREKMNEQMSGWNKQLKVLQEADKETIQKVKAERDVFKLKVKEKEETILQKTNELFKISQDLEEEKKDNQNKVDELKKWKQKYKDSKNKRKALNREIDEMPEIVSQVLNQFSSKRRKRAVSCSSSCSEIETCPETSTSSMPIVDGDNDNAHSICQEVERLEPQDVIQAPTRLAKERNAEKKRGRDDDASTSTNHNEPKNILITFPEIAQIDFRKKSNK